MREIKGQLSPARNVMALSASLSAQEGLVASLSQVPQQQGVLTLSPQGDILQREGEISEAEGKQVFLMLQDTQSILGRLGEDSLQSLTVNYKNFSLVVTFSGEQIVVLKKGN